MGDFLFDILHSEMIKYFSLKSGKDVTSFKLNRDEAEELESMGFDVGVKLGETILMDGIRVRDELDYMRFIAKDLWISLFGKQVDNLRTDNNGMYELLDKRFRPLMSISNGHQFAEQARVLLLYPSGLIRGVLHALGLSCLSSVADVPALDRSGERTLPAARFTFTIQRS